MALRVRSEGRSAKWSATVAAVTMTASHLEAVRCLDSREGHEAGRSYGPKCVTRELCVEAVVALVPVLGGYSGIAERPVLL